MTDDNPRKLMGWFLSGTALGYGTCTLVAACFGRSRSDALLSVGVELHLLLRSKMLDAMTDRECYKKVCMDWGWLWLFT